MFKLKQRQDSTRGELKGAPRPLIAKLLAGQKGGLLIEMVVSLAVLGALGSALLTGIDTSYITKNQFQTQSDAENIVRNQMEHIFEQPYVPPPGIYATITPPLGYSIMAEALIYDISSTNIETVRVTVTKEGKTIISLETLRSNR